MASIEGGLKVSSGQESSGLGFGSIGDFSQELLPDERIRGVLFSPGPSSYTFTTSIAAFRHTWLHFHRSKARPPPEFRFGQKWVTEPLEVFSLVYLLPGPSSSVIR